MTVHRIRQGAMLAVLLSTVVASVTPSPATASPARIARVTTTRPGRSRRRRGIGDSAWKIALPAPVAQPRCPADVPVQNVTVIDQAGVPAYRLSLVERAAVSQSLQVRRWWGTPCVQFAPNGWKLNLKRGPFDGTSGAHFYNGSPYMNVWTGQLNYEAWSEAFTHEIVETLADPQTTRSYTLNDANGGGIEIADPVALRGYRLDGVWVTDFVTPAYYAGARYGTCVTVVQSEVECDGPVVASATAAGPYDQMRLLSRPWQTTWATAG